MMFNVIERKGEAIGTGVGILGGVAAGAKIGLALGPKGRLRVPCPARSLAL